MNITHLSLTNFRNYPRLEYSFRDGLTILYGANAQGKTNILESIYYLATTKSPYTSHDQQIINWQANQADDLIVVSRIMATINTAQEESERQIELRLIKEIKKGEQTFRREALINRRKVRLIDLLGKLRVVLFLPTDMDLITGSPANRRRYLDISLCQSDSTYCRTLSAYNKVLEQRNAALRQCALNNGRGKEIISILDEKLVPLGTTLFVKRATYMQALTKQLEEIHYQHLTREGELIRLDYLPRLSEQKSNRLLNDSQLAEYQKLFDFILENSEAPEPISETYSQRLRSGLERDLASGTTSIGPHRDDWQFQLNSHSLADFGSRGQQRTAILAYKLAELERMAIDTGENPLLLLDDVIAELDEQRRGWVLDYIADKGQTFVTSTDLDQYSQSFLDIADKISVKNGGLHSIEFDIATDAS